ncbi:hypothetical protein [Litoreibacter halocynthiae]|nr:hypothetical protein [Litoreibacter halocynthiae]
MTHPALDISEPGQSAFAAIAEITSLLQNDPTTDWSRVNIEPLRQHLIDMDLVTVRAYVSTEQTEEGAVFTITGDERTLQAIRAMVPAHVPFLEKETGWKVQVTEIEHAVLLQVDGTATKIQALGFIGLMTIGAHHQEHHLAMAKGNGIH